MTIGVVCTRRSCHACGQSRDVMNHELPAQLYITATGARIPVRRRSRPPENQSLGAIAHRGRGLSVRGGPEAVKVNSGALRHGYSIVSGPIEGRRVDRAGRAA